MPAAIELIPGYAISDVLFEGERTRIYRATRREDSAAVILKLLTMAAPTPSDVARFRREYKVTQELAMPGVPRAYELAHHGDQWMIIFADIGGHSLDSYVRGFAERPQEGAMVALKICDILEQIHAHGVVHKDINPCNIVLNPNTGQVQVIDFGIAAKLSKEEPFFTSPNLLEGTLAYISPEQTGRMNRSIDYRTDLYSLGVTIFELLVGRLPFTASDPLEVIHCHIAQTAPLANSINPAIPRSVARLVAKLLEKSPEHRYQAAAGVAHDLRLCLDHWDDGVEVLLGAFDSGRRFEIPRKLYGRAEQTASLLQAFTRAATGWTEVAIVHGQSGIGKSAVVSEVQKKVVKQHGMFVAGKFDQYQQSTPYQPFLHAFRALLRLFLSSGTNELALWRSRILKALKDNGQILADVLPELTALTGPLPPVPQLPLLEAMNRFRMVVEDFVCAVATIDHPLVLFLDDLQWADASSLKLIEHLASEPDQQSLLLILAFRSNEVGDHHPLRATLRSLQNRQIQALSLEIGPLSVEDVTAFVADALRAPLAEVEELGALCAQKTGGNPFFLGQMLRLFYERGYLTFSAPAQRFLFDMEAIRQVEVAGNVVDVIIAELRRLPPLAGEILAHAACVGNEFDLQALATIVGRSRQEVATQLTLTVEQGIIVPMVPEYRLLEVDASEIDVRFRFAHDRIQQAAYKLLEAGDLAAANLRIGRYLEQHGAEGDELFACVTHLYAARSLLSAVELRQLARLALKAGVAATSASAYESAFRFFELGLELLGQDGWETLPALALELHTRLVQTGHYANQIDQMVYYFKQLQTHVEDPSMLIDAHIAMTDSLSQRSYHADAIDLSLTLLDRLGVHIPRRVNLARVALASAKNHFLISRRRLAKLPDAPEASDPKHIKLANLINRVTVAALFYDPLLSGLMTQQQVRLMLRKGISEPGVLGLAAYGIINTTPILKRYQLAYDSVRTAVRLAIERKYRLAQALTAFHGNGMVFGWKNAVRSSSPRLEDVSQACFEVGDLEIGSYALNACLQTRLFTWEHLGNLLEGARTWLKTVRRHNQKTAERNMVIYAQVIANLMGEGAHPEVISGEFMNEGEVLAEAEAVGDKLALYLVWALKSALATIFGNYKEAVAAFARTAPYHWGGETIAPIAPQCRILSIYAQLRLLTPGTWRSRLKLISMANDFWYVYAVARANPSGFGWSWALLRAETARLRGQREQAFEAFRVARMKATESEYLFAQAFVQECTGRFSLSVGDQMMALQNLRDARRLYAAWGAESKAKQLDREFPLLRETFERRSASKVGTIGTAREASQTLDLESILRSSQAVSSELQMATLIERVMKITLENAGATRGFLLLFENTVLKARVRGSVTPTLNVASMQVPIDALGAELCTAIAHYVARTGETIVLTDGGNASSFQADPYLARKDGQSIACLPIANQGACIGVLYLENELTVDAFTPNRMKTLALLATQSAISLKNVQYVEDLKDKVRLENDLRAAHAVQEALLPPRTAAVPGMELTMFYESADQTGGDWFGYHYDEASGDLFLQIGDVTGHGVPSALVTAAVCGAILGAYRLVAATAGKSLTESVWQLAEAANDAVAATGQRVGRSMTMAFIGLNTKTGKGVYFNAAHVPVYLRSEGKVRALLRGGELLGDFRPDSGSRPLEFDLGTGDVLFLFTDGLLENTARGGRRLKEREVRQLIASAASGGEIKERLTVAYEKALHGQRPVDDCTYVILRRIS